MNLQLISDKAALFFLEQFEDVPKEVEETKRLIERKIVGDDLIADEWENNVNNYANVTVFDYARGSATAIYILGFMFLATI